MKNVITTSVIPTYEGEVAAKIISLIVDHSMSPEEAIFVAEEEEFDEVGDPIENFNEDLEYAELWAHEQGEY